MTTLQTLSRRACPQWNARANGLLRADCRPWRKKPRPGKQRVLDERGEARLIAEACTPAPEGRERWTLQLLADRVVALQLAASCSKDTVWRVLKKTNLNRG